MTVYMALASGVDTFPVTDVTSFNPHFENLEK